MHATEVSGAELYSVTLERAGDPRLDSLDVEADGGLVSEARREGRDEPKQIRLSLHVFRLKVCDNILDQERVPAVGEPKDLLATRQPSQTVAELLVDSLVLGFALGLGERWSSAFSAARLKLVKPPLPEFAVRDRSFSEVELLADKPR